MIHGMQNAHQKTALTVNELYEESHCKGSHLKIKIVFLKFAYKYMNYLFSRSGIWFGGTGSCISHVFRVF